MSKTVKVVIGALILAMVGLGVFLVNKGSAYEVKFAMPSAAQLAKGSPVLIRGFQVGNVSDLEASIVTLRRCMKARVPRSSGRPRSANASCRCSPGR